MAALPAYPALLDPNAWKTHVGKIAKFLKGDKVTAALTNLKKSYESFDDDVKKVKKVSMGDTNADSLMLGSGLRMLRSNLDLAVHSLEDAHKTLKNPVLPTKDSRVHVEQMITAVKTLRTTFSAGDGTEYLQ